MDVLVFSDVPFTHHFSAHTTLSKCIKIRGGHMSIYKAKATLAIAAMTLAGCGGSNLASSTTRSSFESLSGNEVNISLSQERNGTLTAGSVGRASYVVGVDTQKGQMVAASGYTADQIGAARTNGSGNYTTTYRYALIDDVNRSTTLINGYTREVTGGVTVNADFDAGTLKANGTYFDIDATISGDRFSGTADVSHLAGRLGTSRDQLRTTLQGRIGASGLIGAFHGSDSDTVMAGGIVGTPAP